MLLAAAPIAIACAQDVVPADAGSWQADIQAGPYSTVNTATGILTTRMPLINLKGPGNTVLSFEIAHTSRSSERANEKTQVARNWFSNYHEYAKVKTINEGSQPYSVLHRNSAFGILSTWLNDSNKGYPRMYGGRDDVTRVGSGPFEVTLRGDRSKLKFAPVPNMTSDQHFLQEIKDVHGNTVTLQYDQINGRLQKVTDATGLRYITFNYLTGSTYGLQSIVLTHPVDSNGLTSHTWTFITDTNGRMSSVVYPSTSSAAGSRPYVEFTYGSNGNIATIKDPEQNTWSYGYSSEKCTSFTAPGATLSTTLNYSGTGTESVEFDNGTTGNASVKYTTVTDPLGRLTRHVYLYTGNLGGAWSNSWPWIDYPLIRVEHPSVDGVIAKERTVWNLLTGLPHKKYSARNVATTYQWDTQDLANSTIQSSYGDLLSSTVVDSTVTPSVSYTATYTYNSQHKLTYVKRANLRSIQYWYDDPTATLLTRERTYATSTSVAEDRSYVYDTDGRMTQSKVGLDPATVFSDFDPLSDRPRVTTSPTGAVTTSWYDGLGRRYKMTTPDSRVWEWTYDYTDRLIAEKLPETVDNPGVIPTTQKSYNRAGRIAREVDGKGQYTMTKYDAQGRVSSIQVDMNGNHVNYVAGDPADIYTNYGYDAVGNLTSVSKGGTTTNYEFDARDRLRKILYADGTTREFRYDLDNNRNVVIDGNGFQSTSNFDGLGRVIRQDFSDGLDVDFQYFGMESVATSRKETPLGWTPRTFLYVYDNALRLQSSYNPYAGEGVSYTYEPLTGRRKTMSVGTYTWTYNYTDGQLTSLNQNTDPVPIATFEYQFDRLSRKVFKNGNATQFTYDAAGRPAGTYIYENAASPSTPGTLSQWSRFVYDLNGNPRAYTSEITGATRFEDSFTYDRSDRLLTESRTRTVYGPANTVTPLYANEFSYDAAGNRTRAYRQDLVNGTNNSATANYTYASNNRFVSGDGYSVPSWVNTTTPKYNQDGSVLAMNAPDGSPWTFTYDDRQNLVNLGKPGVNVGYLYDSTGQRMYSTVNGSYHYYIYDGNTVIAEKVAGVLTRFYVDKVGEIDGSGNMQYYRENVFGSTVATSTSTGYVTPQSEYDAFGAETPVTGNRNSASGYGSKHGYKTDIDSGLIFCRSRYYVPRLGRFISRDPIGHDGGLNLYEYCDNNPLAKVDPDGKTPIALHLAMQSLTARVPKNIVYGGFTIGQKSAIYSSLVQVANTPTGHRLLSMWGNKPLEFMVHNSEIIGKNSQGRIDISFDFMYSIMIRTKSRGWGDEWTYPGLPRIIAHELGHAIAGDRDDGWQKMNNTDKWENPIAKEMGLRRRTEYDILIPSINYNDTLPQAVGKFFLNIRFR